jgi:hypothetical protein
MSPDPVRDFEAATNGSALPDAKILESLRRGPETKRSGDNTQQAVEAPLSLPGFTQDSATTKASTYRSGTGG